MIYALALILLLAFSAFFSMSEIALASLNKLRLQSLADDGNKAAIMAKNVKERSTDALSSILVGNNLVNIAASSLTTLIAMQLMPHNEALGGTIATVVITVLTLIFGEIMPKMIGKRFAIPVACTVSYPLRTLMFLFLPITLPVRLLVNKLSRIWKKNDVGPTVTEEELSTIIDTVEEEGVIDEDKSELLQSALDFSDRTAADILTPRIDLVAVDEKDSAEEVYRTVKESGFSRYPVYRGTVDHITGILQVSTFLKDVAENGFAAVTVADHVKETAYVHKTAKLPDVFERMKEYHCHMIVVLDEYGGTLGVVTMETVIEDIVGDIWDEDEIIEREIREIGPDVYEVLGQTNIRDLFDEIDFEDRDFDSEYKTVGGWAIEMLDDEACEGATFVYKNLEVKVTETGDNTVEKLSVRILPPENAENDA